MYNKNSGYGQHVQAHSFLGGGQAFVVAKSAAVGRQILQEVFPPDPDGKNRFAATIDAATEYCTANRGDVIYVAPGHTETLSNATSLLLDVAGITLIGLGEGSLRPTITLDTATTATIPVSAADITVKNMIFAANFADIVSFFTLTTANNFKLKDCLFKATATNMNAKYVVDTNATTSDADGLTIEGCTWIEPDTSTESMVKMDGDNYRVTIKNNFVQLGVKNNTPALMAIITGKSVFNADIGGNKVYRLNTDTATGGILVSTDQSDNSGIVYNNFAQHADTAAEILVTASSGFAFFDNKASGVAGASGYTLPAVDS